MVLGFDIGNTHIVVIFYNKDGKILSKFRIPTHSSFTEDVLFLQLKGFCEYKKLDISTIKNIIISSVVPNINEIFEYLGKKYFDIKPKFVSMDYFEKKLKMLPNSERGLGADRIVDILAVKRLYSNKEKDGILIIDFGTATTFDVIKDSIYMGGCILPGINLSINALFKDTAKLPKVSFEKTDTVYGIDTVTQINAGIFYGNVGAIKELILQYKKVLPDLFVITTGGQGKEISNYLEEVNEYIENLGEIGIFECSKLEY